MNAVDTSVVVPAASPWHDGHARARAVCSGDVRLPAHVAVETFAVLTRFPPPHRVSPSIARQWLARRFGNEPVVVFPAAGYPHLLDGVVSGGIAGVAVYDALVGATARAAGAMLVTMDRRAARTYEVMGVPLRLLD
ncbi:MAG TPA: PIN domain-containing protein [Acidimicrobiales bacterium]|nr:PIN domain-containing protein [Acidimicrobiales bacterium]